MFNTGGSIADLCAHDKRALHSPFPLNDPRWFLVSKASPGVNVDLFSMKTYKFFDVQLMAGEIRLWCSDPSIVTRIIAELEKTTRFSVAHNVLDLSQDLYPGQSGHYILNKFKGMHEAAFVWILRQLCEEGWEPFSTALGTIEASRVVSFRITFEV